MQHEQSSGGVIFPTHTNTRSNKSMFEYQLVAFPNEALSQQIQQVRQELSDTHQVAVLSSKPFVEICRYQALESMEETLSRWWQRLCGQNQALTIVLNNISGIPFKSIHLRVQNQQVFHGLHFQMSSINDYITSYQMPDIHKQRNPKIVLAQHLSESLYERAMFDYAHHEFHASFTVEELVLLKREIGRDVSQRIQVFGLAPQLTGTLVESNPLIY